MENQNQILLALGEIKGQISGFISALNAQSARAEKHDERLRSLENSRSKTLGYTAGVAGVVSTAVTLVGLVISYWK